MTKPLYVVIHVWPGDVYGWPEPPTIMPAAPCATRAEAEAQAAMFAMAEPRPDHSYFVSPLPAVVLNGG